MTLGKKMKSKKKNTKKLPSKKTGGFRDWISLPLTLKNKKNQAQLEMRQIQNAYILYRAQNISYEYFATNTDRNLADLFTRIQKEMGKLATMETDLYFRRFSLAALRRLDTHLDEVINNQKELIRKIQIAPVAFDFYNRMSFFKSKHHLREQEERELWRILSKARKNLEHALNYFSEYEKERSTQVCEASILSMERAKEFWELKIAKINAMEKESVDPALVVTDIETLTKIIFDTPALTKWVDAVEKRFKCLSLDHALLVETYGKRIIPQEILDEFTDLLYTAIPKLWSTGEAEQLNQHLTELDTFISTYQADVENEIKFAQRHERRETHATEKSVELSKLSEMARLFITALDARDPIMKTHSQTVAHLVVKTAKQMNWEQKEIQYLEIAALLHDVGKLWIPENILTKKTKLTNEEIKIYRMHPVNGVQILQSSNLFKKITPWIYHHHELWNGTGYPDGLKESDIPVHARIIAVCNSFTTMLSGSHVLSALTVEQSIEQIKMESGVFFDPVIVESFVKVVESQEMEYLKKYVEK
jgi:putative nucleotidyltransferase with HDIG domain